MAFNEPAENFTGRLVKETYQSVIHVGISSSLYPGALFDGTGSLIEIPWSNISKSVIENFTGSGSLSSTASYALLAETASYVEWNNIDNKPFELVNQLDCDLGVDVVDQFITSSGRTAEWLINVYSGSNMRSSKVLACWLGSEVRFTEQSTNDIGNTKKIDFQVDISSSFIRLLCDNTDANNWEIKTLRTII